MLGYLIAIQGKPQEISKTHFTYEMVCIFQSPNQYTRKKFQNFVKSFFLKRYTEIWRIKRKNLGRVYLGLPFF